MLKPSLLSATTVSLTGFWLGGETSLEHSKDRQVVLFVIPWLVRMASCRTRSVGLARIVSMGIVCSSGSRVVITLLVRFVGILSIMVDSWVRMRWERRGKIRISESGNWIRPADTRFNVFMRVHNIRRRLDLASTFFDL